MTTVRHPVGAYATRRQSWRAAAQAVGLATLLGALLSAGASAGHAAGNVGTEDLVFMCEEMGITTGVDLEALLETARLAENIVGHPLPGCVKSGGSLARLRASVAA